VQNNTVNFTNFIKYLLPEEKDAVEKKLMKTFASHKKSWSDAFMFKRHDGSVAAVTSRAIIIRDREGKAIRLIGATQDVSRLQELEERLEQEIKLKAKQIAEAIEDARNAERSAIGKELHDNINQLLGASRMFLEIGKQGGENSMMYLSRSYEYILTAIEEIRKLTKGLITDIIKTLGLSEAIDNVTRNTMEVNPVKISCDLESFKEDSVNDKFKLNAFRIVQEQLNNILKHAGATEVIINLSQNKKSIILSISDNGVGFDTGKKYKGIGLANIKTRAASYFGTADFDSKPGQGCILTVTFPVTNAILNKVLPDK
jgi:signal transduction histidine kinase